MLRQTQRLVGFSSKNGLAKKMLRKTRRLVLIYWRRITTANWFLLCVLATIYFVSVWVVTFNVLMPKDNKENGAIQMSSTFNSEIHGEPTLATWVNRPKNNRHQRNKKDHSLMFKKILFWNSYFSSKDFELGLGHTAFKDAGCRTTNCLLTDDRNLLDASDAVIFHANDFNERDLPDPHQRRPNQRFIFYNYETMVTASDMPMFTQTNNFFNWTMTYRRDSDIYDVRTYGAIQRRTNALPPPTSMPVRLSPEVLPPDPASMMMTNNNKSISSRHHFLLAKKTKMVAWFVSHCRTDSLREKYFQSVGQQVVIDTYGSCGSLTCFPLRSEKCDELLDSYKFYVAAENAICPDYVTEKFYRAMAADIVPIVYGGADYSAYAPPMSYIDAGDFKSPKALADYLKLLDENDGLYLKYFDWKKDYEVVSRPVSGWCELCEKLNDPQQKPKVYEDITDWWYHKDIACLSGYDYLDNLLQQNMTTF